MKVGISEFFFFSPTHLYYNLNSSLLEFEGESMWHCDVKDSTRNCKLTTWILY